MRLIRKNTYQRIFKINKEAFIKNNKILILGAASFSGRFLIEKLLKFNCEIHGADKAYIARSQDLNVYQCDLSDQEKLKNILREVMPNYIVNLVGLVAENDFEELYGTNVGISQCILDWSISAGKKVIKRILFIGSAAEYGLPEKNPVSESANLAPLNFYGLSKLMQSELALLYKRRFSAPVLIARTFNLYGEGLNENLAIGYWEKKIRDAKDGESILVGNIETWRDYISIEEATVAYLQILFCGDIGEVYNVCSGVPLKMENILKDMIQKSGKKIKIKITNNLKRQNEVTEIFGDRRKLEKILDRKITLSS